MALKEVVIVRNMYPAQVVASEMAIKVTEELKKAGVTPEVVDLNPEASNAWGRRFAQEPDIRLKLMAAEAAKHPSAVVFEFQDSPVSEWPVSDGVLKPIFLQDELRHYTEVIWPAVHVAQNDPKINQYAPLVGLRDRWFLEWMSDPEMSAESGLCSPEWITSVAQHIISLALENTGS